MIAVVYCKLLGSVNNIWGRRARADRHTQNFFRNFLVESAWKHTIYYPPGLLSVPESTLYTIHRAYYCSHMILSTECAWKHTIYYPPGLLLKHTIYYPPGLVCLKAHYILSTGLIISVPECWSIHTLDIEIFIIFIFILLPPVFWHASPSSYFQLQKPFKYQNVQIFDDMMAIYSASSYSFNFSNYSYFSTFFSPIEINGRTAKPSAQPLFLPMLYARN